MQVQHKPKQPVFHVTFMDGAVLTMAAETSLRAEAKASKSAPASSVLSAS